VVRGDEPTIAAAPGGFLAGYGQFPAAGRDGAPVQQRAPRAGVLIDATSGSTRSAHPAPEHFAAVVGGLAVYAGSNGDVRAVDLADGKTRWARPTGPPGARPVAVAGQPGAVYLLLRAPNQDGVVAGDSGALTVVLLDLGSGTLRLNREYRLTEPKCVTSGDGRRRCDNRPAGLLAGPGVLIVYEHPVSAGPVTWLGALG
jgi:hypothetical protein